MNQENDWFIELLEFGPKPQQNSIENRIDRQFESIPLALPVAKKKTR